MRRFLLIPFLALAVGAAGSPAGAAGPVAVPAVSFFPATSGLFYSATVGAAGGTAPYTFAVVSGSLPHGLSLSSDGTISGVPDDSPGLFSFAVQALDANGEAATGTFVFPLATPTILLTSVGIPAARVGESYRYALKAWGGSAPYVFNLSAGSLPDGLRLSGEGAFTGTPTAAGVSLFTVQIIDAHGNHGAQTFRLVVEDAKPAPRKTRPHVPRLPRLPHFPWLSR